MRIISTVSVLTLVATGCFKAEETFIPEDLADVGIFSKKGIGEECGNDNDCREGLDCSTEGLCEPSGEQVIGQVCTTSPECQPNAYCGIGSVCVLEGASFGSEPCTTDDDCAVVGPNASCLPDLNPTSTQKCLEAGDGGAGDACASDGDCEAGLACQYTAGVIGICGGSGTTDIGGACDGPTDCYAGLVCSAGACQPWNVALAEAAAWEGAVCDAEDLANPRAYFEVPREDGQPLSEFYRLPFPNDIRSEPGRITTGHASPGAGPLPFDPVQRVLDAVNEGLDGFGTTPTVLFRFSAPVDFNSVIFNAENGQTNMRYVNVDADSPRYKANRGYVWSASTSREKYLCNHWIRIRNGWSDPLEPDTTYAVFLLKGITVTEGEGRAAQPFNADGDLGALLSESAPSDARLADAWTKYAPLRAYLAEEGIPAGDVLNAAVFTTGKPTELVEKAREQVQKIAVPTVSDVVVCGDGVTSPCAEEGAPNRDCGVLSGAFTEIHGKISLPIFQKGTAPYLEPQDGGEIAVSSGGVPQVQRTEEVCFSMTIPNGQPPAEGWPVVLYAHGTGGTFRSHAGNGVASNLAQLPSGGAVVLGIDGSMHGPRRGDSSLDPEVLYFNFANPAAARGNAYQGAIDYFTLARFAAEFTGEFGSVGAVPFNTEKMGFWGHSQGASVGPLFLAFEPLVDVAVLSGAGAGVLQSVLEKRNPVDIPSGVSAVLREQGSDTQPVLSLFQQYFDPVDPLNYAKLIGREPPAGVEVPHQVLVVYGQGDTYTPPSTTRTLGDVLDIPVVSPLLDGASGEAFDGISDTDRELQGPLSGNKTIGESTVTMAMIHHAPDGYDGHFVAFQNVAAVTRITSFFDSFFGTGLAIVEASNTL